MENYYTRFLFVLLIGLTLPRNSTAQCNTNTCQIPMPEVNAMDACILDSPHDLDCYYGSTTSDAPISLPPFWCTTIENNHWFAFTADATSVSFDISCYGCATGGAIQAAILETTDCIDFTFVSNCLGNIQTQTTQNLSANGLVPGNNYYICIDGNAGAQCDYAINASVPTVNGPTDGLCIPSSPAGVYTTSAASNWTIAPPTAGQFVGSSTGTTVTVQWLEPGPAQICATSVQCPNSPPFCLDVVVGEDSDTDEYVDVCQGHTTTCAGHTYSSGGNFMVNLPSFLNCDSIIHCHVTLIPTVHTTETVYMCQNGSATCAGEEFDAPGSFNVTLEAYQGCDSVVTCKVVQVPLNMPPIQYVTMCGPAQFPVCGNIYDQTGFIQETCTSFRGCDSIVRVDLAILEPVAHIATPDTLNCDTHTTVTLNGTGSSINNATGGLTLYHWYGPGIVGNAALPTVVVNQPGNYCLVLTHSRSGILCMDTACVTVHAVSAVPQLPQITGNGMPCGDSTLLYSATAVGTPAPTSFNWTLPGGVPFTQVNFNTIQVTWNTVVSGNMCVTASNSCGSSQPACLPITVQPPIQQPQLSGPANVCAGGGNYDFTLNLQQIGVNYTWTVPPGAVLTGSGDTVHVNFLNAVSGNVCVTPSNLCGTGTPVCQNVHVSPVPTGDLTNDAVICNGESVNLHFALTGNGPFDVTWQAGNQTMTLNDIVTGHTETVSPSQTTVYKLLSVSDNSMPACAINLADSVKVTVHPYFSQTQSAQICQGDTYFVGGAAQTVSGVYTDSLSSVFGCDSVIITTLTVLPVDTTVLNTTTCDPSQAGTTVVTLQQTNGCDSVVMHTITLLPSDTTYLFDHSCDVNNVGVFTTHFTNHWGCDSMVVKSVTYALSDTTYLTGHSCDPAATGVFMNHLLSADGCDSLIITTVDLLQKDTVYLTGTSCNPAQVGVFTNSFVNQYGCDSTIITTITFVPLDTTYLTASSCDPAATGVFTNHITTSGGCDSVIVTTVSLLPSSTTNLTGSSCNPAEVGVFTNHLFNQFGCDSTIITTITFAPLDTTFLTGTSCDPAATGVFTNHITTSGGCDSIIVTSVSLLPSSSTQLFDKSCNPNSVGVFVTHLTNQFGCDSTVTLTVTFSQIDSVFLTATTCDPAMAGVFSENLVTPEGCDSVTIHTVSLLPSNQTAVQTFTCDPAMAGIFTYPLVNQYGCDSIVTETRSLLPSSTTTVNLTTCDPTQVGTVTTHLTNHFGCDSTVLTVTTLLPANNCSVVGTALGGNIPCGATTGTLTVTMTVGTPPFDFTVKQGANTVQTGTIPALNTPYEITGLPAGTYNVVVGSPNGYNTTTTATLVQLVPPSLTAVASSSYHGFDVSCFGANDGKAGATANGGQAPYQFVWSNGGTTQQITGLVAGTYTATVTDANGCTNVSTVTLNEPTQIQLSFAVNPLDCFSENDGAIEVQTVGGAPPFQYQMNQLPLQNSNLFGNLAAGSYTITAFDANDCSQTEVIAVNAAVPVDVELGDNITILLGDSTVIQALVNVPIDSIEKVVWTPPYVDPECTICLTREVKPFVSTVYTIQVTTLNGCTDEDKVTIIVDRSKQIYVPNVFTPNFDGANDLFSIYARPGIVKNIHYLKVFDRWGNELYVQNDFLPNSPSLGWDGTFNGKPMNPGVFVWVAEIEFTDGEKALYKGDVTILR